MTLFSPQNMTDTTTPFPFVASSNQAQANYEAYRAFNTFLGNPGFWIRNSNTGWLSLDIGAGNSEILATYDLYANTLNEGTRVPKDWTIEGSNSGAFAGEEDTLDTVTGETAWGNGEGRTFTCDVQTTAYRYFRINITANNGDVNNTVIALFNLYTDEVLILLSPEDMTSDIAPAPFVASANQFQTSFDPHKAFKLGGTFPYWIRNSDTGWLALDIGLGNDAITSVYYISANLVNEPLRMPKDWTLEGSATGIWAGEEDILDTVTGEVSWGNGERRRFECDVTDTGYRYFRVNITDNNGDGSNTVIALLQLYEATITKVITPTALPTSGEYPSSQTIVLSTTTPGADIYYTTDGSTPDETDTLYTTPISVFDGDLKAIGIDPLAVLDDSDIMTEVYTIAAPPALDPQPIITIQT